jgi:hypothetical protein
MTTKKKKQKQVKEVIELAPLVRPTKKKELEAFWNSINIDNLHLLTDEDYEAYRRFVDKKEKNVKRSADHER